MKVKLILLSSLIFMSVLSFGQKLPIDPETKKITFTEVVELPVKMDDLYSRAKTWFVTGSGATKLALELDDKETGKMIGKVVNAQAVKNPPMGMFEVGNVSYTVTIIVKEGKYKYTFTDFIHESGGMNNVISAGPLEAKKTTVKFITQNMPTQYQWGQIKENTDETVLKQIETLKKVMSGTGKKDTDF